MLDYGFVSHVMYRGILKHFSCYSISLNIWFACSGFSLKIIYLSLLAGVEIFIRLVVCCCDAARKQWHKNNNKVVAFSKNLCAEMIIIIFFTFFWNLDWYIGYGTFSLGWYFPDFSVSPSTYARVLVYRSLLLSTLETAGSSSAYLLPFILIQYKNN